MKPKTAVTEELLKFPLSFPIKIMGKREDSFTQTIADLVLQHAPDFDPATIEFKKSKEGNYIGLTVTINAVSRAQLDALYMALTKHPSVKYIL